MAWQSQCRVSGIFLALHALAPIKPNPFACAASTCDYTARERHNAIERACAVAVVLQLRNVWSRAGSAVKTSSRLGGSSNAN